MTITPAERHSRFHLPSSLRLLLSPGIRGHTLLFMSVLGFIFVAAYVGRALAISSTWTVVFAAGASASATYLLLAPLAGLEKIRTKVLFARMSRRLVMLGLVYGSTLSGVSYWIYKAGSVEALPIFPYFIAIFYAWILSQAYFIATPISHAMMKIENSLIGKSLAKKITRTLGIAVLFLPIAPLGIGVWEISNWANQNYSNIAGAGTDILAWTLIVTLTVVASYFLTVNWGWKNIKNGRPQTAIFAGGTFLIVWGYLLYRAAGMLINVVTQNQPSSPLIDIGLMVISIFGAMQTFARKTVSLADRRWSLVLPFLVFAFGSVYAVAQFYFILQVALTRADLSAFVNGTVFVVGTLTLMLLLRSHLKIPNLSGISSPNVPPSEQADTIPSSRSSDSYESVQDTGIDTDTQFAEPSDDADDSGASPRIEETEQSEQSGDELLGSESQ